MKLRATPIEKFLVEPEESEDAYPDGSWVHARTNLVFPQSVLYPEEDHLDPDVGVWCGLLSPGTQAGGRTSTDEDTAFSDEAIALTRMLSFMGIPIVNEEAA